MDVLLDDILNGVLNQVQHNVVPTLENVTKHATQRIFAPRPPPKSTDLCYLTDRLIVSSRPAPANPPTFHDVGRDPPRQRRAPQPNFESKLSSMSTMSNISSATETSLGSKNNVVSGTSAPANDSKKVSPAKASDSSPNDNHKGTNPAATTSNGANGEQKCDNDEEEEEEENRPKKKKMTIENPQEGGSDDVGRAVAPIESASNEMEIANDIENDNDNGANSSKQNEQAETPIDMSQTQTIENSTNSTETAGKEVDPAESSATPPTRDEPMPDANGTIQKEINDTEEKQKNNITTDINDSLQAPSDSAPVDKEPEPVDKQSPLGKNEQDSQKSTEATKMEENEEKNATDVGDHPDSQENKKRRIRTQEEPPKTAKTSEAVQTIDVDGNEQKADPIPVQNDDSAAKPQPPTNDDDENDSPNPSTGHDDSAQDKETPKANVAQHELPASKLSYQKNSPAEMTAYLDKRHGKNRYLAFSLADEVPDDRTLLLFRRQIVQLGWWSPCLQRSETPSIPRILKACYAIHAFLQLNPSNVALVYCNNGKTRTAIVVSCYLKFAGVVQHSHEGFLHFLTKNGISNPEATWKQLPPSLHLFFRQFDSTVDMGGFMNRKPLLLRAIALQGIPVEDKPCLDIWDSSQRHVYTSHPELWDKDEPVRKRMEMQSKSNKPNSQWADEEGFYKVNVVLDGDFLLLCRFGGEFAKDAAVHDPSKILFRYVNTTGFMSGGCPYELPAHKVDLMRQYANHLEDEDFLVTLLFEGGWERIDIDNGNPIEREVDSELSAPSHVCNQKIWKSHEVGAWEEGLQIIFQRHSANPDGSDIRNFKMSCRSREVSQCMEHLLCLALQLSNFDFGQAERLVQETPSFSWWSEQKKQSIPNLPSIEEKKDIEKKNTNSQNEKDASEKILDLLMDVDVTPYLEAPDVEQFLAIEDRFKDHHEFTKLAPTKEHDKTLASDSIRHSTFSGIPAPFIKDTGWMVPSILYPNSGDISRSFAPNYPPQYLSSSRSSDNFSSLVSQNKPRIPLFERDKPAMIPPPPKRIKSNANYTGRKFPMPPYHPQREAALELLIRMRHTGVSLSQLLDLAEASQKWSHVPVLEDEPEVVEEVQEEQSEAAQTESRDATMNREAKELQEKKWQEARKAEAQEKEEKKKSSDANRKDSEEKKSEKPEEEKKKEDSEKKQDEAKEEKPAEGGEVALKDDPDYAKYFKMLKMGMAKEQVLHAMKRDDKDPIVLDLDPNKSFKSQMPEEPKPTDGDVPLKDDPEYEKYFKMLKMGLPMGAVKNALTRDEKDPTIMDLDPNKSLKSQRQPAGGGDDGPPLKEDPEYEKYFKMLKMGLPMGAVKNALTKDGKDPSIMDLDPEKSLKSQTGGAGGGDDGPPLKDDPEYAKYFKMLTMGLPIGAVKNALSRDGKDPSIMDLDPNKSLKSQLGGGTEEDSGPPLKEDPDYAKYFKMLTMGLPIGAVKNALSRDGKDPAIMDLDPNKSLKSQTGGAEEKDTGIPLKDDPEYMKYFKMASMGLPPGAVKNAMERDGKNPAVLDLDPNKSVAFQLKKKAGGSKKPAKKKKRVRRKKIYWNPIDPGKMKKDSMWSIVRGSVVMDKLNYDPKEFDDLFTESADPADKKKEKKSGGDKGAKKLVQVIDGKKSMNGGIILARLKTDYSKIAGYIDKMEHGKFDSTQLKALKEYLADADERRGIMAYMQPGEKSPEVKEKLYSELSETEKYMWTMMEVKDAPAKFDALLFRSNFKSRFEDISTAIRTLNAACDELRSSEKLRKLMAMILTVVNQINTGGEGNMAVGFTLDALLKLNEAKAFDKKTSVLHYVIKLVKKNDPEVVAFCADLGSVGAAENIILDGLNTDVTSLGEELKQIHETIKAEADRLEQAGELKPMTLADLAEQKTAIKKVGSVPQYNKTDHLTGRTPMERFACNAKVACDEASESITDVKKKYAALIHYFDEDEGLATADFFGIFRRFMLEWKKAVEQVEAIEKKEAKEKKKAAAKAAKDAKKAGKKADKGGGVPDRDKKHVQLPKLLKKSDKAESETAKPASMAAAAAAAAAAKTENTKQPEGIAAFAAAAAMRKKKDDSKPSDSAGGIAAFAAAAAMRKKKSASNSHKATDSKSETQKEKAEDTKGAPPAGGIAAFAAAAARRKAKPSETPTAENKDKQKTPTAGPNESTKKTSNEDSKATPPAGGIAAFAAAAARRKAEASGISGASESTKKVLSSDASKNAPPSGGIGAFAAAAARRKAEASGSQTTENEEKTKTASGSSTDKEKEATSNNDSKATPPAGGIAAFAAAAARRKAEASRVSTPESADRPKTTGINPDEKVKAISSNKKDLSADNEGGEAEPKYLQNKSSGESASKNVASGEKWHSGLTATNFSIGNGAQDMSEVRATTFQEPTKDAKDTEGRDKIPSSIEKSKQETQKPENGEEQSNVSDTGGNDLRADKSLSDGTSKTQKMENLDDVSLETSQGIPRSRGDAKLSANPSADSTMAQNEKDTDTTCVHGDHHESSVANTDIDDFDGRGTSSNSEYQSRGEEGDKSGFAAKAAAYRRRKERKDDSDPAETQSTPLFVSTYSMPSSSDRNVLEKGASVDGSAPGDDRPAIFDSKEIPIPILHDIRKLIEASTDSALAGQANKIGISGNPGNVPPPKAFLPSRTLPQDKDSGLRSPRRGPGLASFLEGGSSKNNKLDALRQNIDDSSVALIAESLQKHSMDSRMSLTWTEGDTIPNWMHWADQVIKASDTESVQGFEMSRDLNDLNDYDDDSTIATYNDDISVASATTPRRISSYISFDNIGGPPTSVSHTFFEQEADPTPVITPAQVAASILFADSPSSSVERPTPSRSNVHRGGRDHDLIDMGLSYAAANEVGLDAGLSFGADDVGLDDGLGFGGDGLEFGGEDYLGMPSLSNSESAEKRKKWFPWGK